MKKRSNMATKKAMFEALKELRDKWGIHGWRRAIEVTDDNIFIGLDRMQCGGNLSIAVGGHGGIVIDEPIMGWLNVSDYKLRKIAKEVVDSILPERMKMEQEF